MKRSIISHLLWGDGRYVLIKDKDGDRYKIWSVDGYKKDLMFHGAFNGWCTYHWSSDELLNMIANSVSIKFVGGSGYKLAA